MKRNISVLIILVAFINLYATGKGVFNVLDYGAQPDGKTICTESINKAVSQCNAIGGGQVYFPPGIYLSGTIVLKDNVELYLEKNSTLLASTSIGDYPIMPKSEYPSREYLSAQVYSKYSIESISIVFLSDCILGIRNLQFSERFDYSYK